MDETVTFCRFSTMPQYRCTSLFFFELNFSPYCNTEEERVHRLNFYF